MSIAENYGGIYANLKLLRDTKGQAECNLFKAMGFDYLYVDEGNNIEKLIDAFQKVKDINHPIVMHIKTVKGHGLAVAEENKTVIAVNAATPGVFGFDTKFRNELGKQYTDVGIAEEHAVAYSSALAKMGAKTILAIMTSFVQRTYDQLSQD